VSTNNHKLSLGQILYEAYAKHAGWKSLATQQPLPQWTILNLAIQQGWEVVAKEARRIIIEEIKAMDEEAVKALYEGL